MIEPLIEIYREFLNLQNEDRIVASRARANEELYHLSYKEMRCKYKGTTAQLIKCNKMGTRKQSKLIA